jgi:hypothetical protein
VIPGREAERSEPGIHNHHREYGFRACAQGGASRNDELQCDRIFIFDRNFCARSLRGLAEQPCPYFFLADSTLKPHVAGQRRLQTNTSRSRGAIRARAWPEISSPCSRRGRGECRVPNAPAAWCALGVVKYAHQYSQRRHRKHPAFPRANGFTTYFALSPGTGLFCPRHRRDAQASSPTWHQRRDARTTRLRRPHRKALVSRSACGHRIPPPTFMTIAKCPSCGGRTGGANHTFLKNRSEIFLRAGLDTPSSLKGLGKLIFRRRALRRAGPRAHRAARARNSPSGESQLRKMGSPITTNVWVVQS